MGSVTLPVTPVRLENYKLSPTAPPAPRLDIRSYVALGSLVIPFESAITSQDSDWHELTVRDVETTSASWRGDLSQLMQVGWCRVFVGAGSCRPDAVVATLRIFLLPDDVGRATVPRTNTGKTRSCLRNIISHVDRSSSAWNGQEPGVDRATGYAPEYAEDDSLFYMFNTLPSPNPDPNIVEEHFAATAMQDVLDTGLMHLGLKTELYPYQRRSAAMMIQMESQPEMHLDPRLEKQVGPEGNAFFLDRNKCQVFVEGKWYHESRGGILGETMGYGKTLISLALVLATKGHLPEIPPEQSHDIHETRPRTGCRSLALQAAATIARNNIQWRLHLNSQKILGLHFEECYKLLEKAVSTYTVETVRGRSRKTEVIRNTFQIAPTTLVIVPSNLLQQWQQQLAEHLEPGALSVLIVDDRTVLVPEPSQIPNYDLIILSQRRFEEEVFPLRGNHTDVDAISTCYCSNPHRRRLCQEHPYRSPLLSIHFLRFIVDEGVGFMSSGSKTQAITALQSIQVERKWIVSGTPANSLIGAEVELAAEQHSQHKEANLGAPDTSGHYMDVSVCEGDTDQEPSPPEAMPPMTWLLPKLPPPVVGLTKVQRALADRKKARDIAEEHAAIARLGTIVKSFLGLKPWANPEGDDAANWNSYFIPDKNGTRKLLSLKPSLQGLVVRHQYEDLESDLQLPSLENKYVYIQPSFIDKLSMNMFLVLLVTNAITSERKDQDYMFHPRNRKSLEVFIRNLRHSGFFWCGLNPIDLEKTCKVARGYLEKPDVTVSTEDRSLMEEAILLGHTALTSPAWRAFAETREIGLFIEQFPEGPAPSWALCNNHEAHRTPLLVGATQLRDAQHKVDNSLYSVEPLTSLNAGPPLPKSDFPRPNKKGEKKALSSQDDPPLMQGSLLSTGSQSTSSTSHSQDGPKTPTKAPQELRLRNIPQSALQDARRLTSMQLHGHESRTPFNETLSKKTMVPKGGNDNLKSILRRANRKPDVPEAYASLAQAKLVGTPSAKLSYLLNRILALYLTEKILVFYEGDDIAFYCAQALEIMEVPHRIYASGITSHLRNQYQTEFNHDEACRVMLVDLKQAALGLHLASASRVFFINPVWQPGIEAQAIKRAHRIGSNKPIKSETLVLKGTLEEELLHRRESMQPEEHRKASRSLLDDAPMKRLFERARLLPVTQDEIRNEQAQIARLDQGHQIFARSIAEAYRQSGGVPSKSAIALSRSDRIPTSLPEPRVSDSSEYSKTTTDSPTSKSLKRKLVFVDELERRTVSKTRKVSASVPFQANGDSDGFTDPSRKRKTSFADEKNMPLCTMHIFDSTEEEGMPLD